MRRSTPEKELQNAILEYLSYLPGCMAWPNDSTGMWDPVKKLYRKRNSKHHRLGVADILGCYRGRFLAIEVKTKTGRLSPEQIVFLKEATELGGLAFVARSVDDVINFFLQLAGVYLK